MTFKAVIFDLDGTLLDTLEDIADSMNHVLRDNGYPERPVQNYRYYVGEGIQQLVYNALEDIRISPEQGKRLAIQMADVYQKHCMNKTRPYENTGRMLQELSASGIQLGVLSNKADGFTRQMVAHYFPQVNFFRVYGKREGVPQKPDPSAVLEILEAMSIQAEEAVFVGDSLIDMQTAVNSSTYPVGVLWGFRDADELLANGARRLLRHPLEMLDLFS
jgi:phosphoglycolate phosphatase